MHKVIINEKTEYAADGTALSALLISSGAAVEHLCGGKGSCKKCSVTVNGKKELSCRYIIKSDITVETSAANNIDAEIDEKKSAEAKKLCYVLDIGTTTLALALVSLDKGEIIRAITRTNPQRAFGADVVTRIEYCAENGPTALTKALIAAINKMLHEIKAENAKKIYVAGNTTMLHLFFGIDCSAMGVAPYTPTFLSGRTASAEQLGLSGIESVEALPSISSFVGSDIVAGLNLIGLPDSGKHSLLVDLGTNAEIALLSKDSLLCTSAAAGPCLEGANISCGMSATAGAIYSYSEAQVKTISAAEPIGICGTGLIDIIAYLLKSGKLDRSGFLECGTLEITGGVHITQQDIRQYQLAKSAIYSAIIVLLRLKGISLSAIDALYISGGFSTGFNINSAVETGLIPKELCGNCVPLNNSSLLGTIKYACKKSNLSSFTEKAEYIDLSLNPEFSDLFIENMMF